MTNDYNAEITIATLNALRADGWLVALHQDQHFEGDELTFWLFGHRDKGWAQGVGETDQEALERVRASIDKMEAERLAGPSEMEELRLALRRIRLKNDEGMNIVQQQTYKIADEALGGEQP